VYHGSTVVLVGHYWKEVVRSVWGIFRCAQEKERLRQTGGVSGAVASPNVERVARTHCGEHRGELAENDEPRRPSAVGLASATPEEHRRTRTPV
jgi:hypothetical protein